jgi:c(7)-type cytochrome triheme protein
VYRQLQTKLSTVLERLTVWRVVAAGILLVGLYATVVRFGSGLGAATNLSDQFPWGLWIGFDVLVGVGLAAGGFVIAATVHIFRLKDYEPVVRPTTLTAFLGYVLVIFALMFDLGRPYRIWHPLVMWNAHSVMFEVAWCVMLYTMVLALEFSPLLFERLGWKRPLKWVKAVFVPLVILGVLLSTLHQSSLGTLYVIAPDKLHGLWYTPMLPVFFFITAIAAGIGMTIIESYLSYRAFGKRLEANLLRGLGRVAVVVLGVYAVMRFQTLAGRGALGLAFQFTPEAVLFWGEMGLGVLLPIALFASRRLRGSDAGLFVAGMLTVMGFVVNRLNVAITGMLGSAGVDYVPSWMEFMVTVAIVTAGFVLFGLAVKHLQVFPQDELVAPPRRGARALALRRYPAFDRNVLIALWALLGVGIAGVALSSERADAVDEAATREVPVVGSAARPADLPNLVPYTFPMGEGSLGPVVFDHSTHVDAAAPRCAGCHTDLFQLLEPGRPMRGELTYERIHEGDLCFSCHNGQGAFSVDDCFSCHR